MVWLGLLAGLLAAEGIAWGARQLWRKTRNIPVSARHTAAPLRPVLLFDGECRFCTAQSKNLLRLAPKDSIEARNFQAPGALDSLPGVTHEACMRAMHLVSTSGRVYEGFEAAAHAVALRPGIGWIAFGYYLPGVHLLCDAGYAIIAANRYRLFGKQVAAGECSDACAVHFKPKPS
jgi:predicted DCC family thiol-disulfide oxidoreductase YuxK